MSVLVISVLVSADMKKLISVFYRYRPIRKFHLSGFIGIGRYEKKLIGRTLGSTNRGNHNTSYGSEEPSLPTSQPPISSQHTNLPALLVSCQPALLNLSHPQGTSKANYLFGSCYRIQIIIIFPDILVSSEEYSMTYLQFFK